MHGCAIDIVDADGTHTVGQVDKDPDALHTRVDVHDMEFYRWIAFGGSTGAGEAYMHGIWSCSDLTALVRILVRNRHVLDDMETGWARISAPFLRFLHRRNRNTKLGSKRNISAHYDLGNDLFEQFLDESMMYSSAIYYDETQSLDQAATAKLDRICEKLALSPTDQLIEIGTGWGGFAIHAAKNYGCHVTTTTISADQHAYAAKRIDQAGLSDKITLLDQDYRDLQGQYDKLVSIEMIEAVGHHFLDTYLAKVSSLLKPDGMALIQAITIEDYRYQRALHDIDFIKRFIFPGSFIPSVAAIMDGVARKTDMRLFNLEEIGPSYAKTLAAWRKRFFANIETVRELGYPETFVRMWEYYLCYCEGGFLERAIGDAQLLLTKPRCRRQEFLPAS